MKAVIFGQSDLYPPEQMRSGEESDFHADPDCPICHGAYYVKMLEGVNVDPPMECISCKGKYIEWMGNKLKKEHEQEKKEQDEQ